MLVVDSYAFRALCAGLFSEQTLSIVEVFELFWRSLCDATIHMAITLVLVSIVFFFLHLSSLILILPYKISKQFFDFILSYLIFILLIIFYFILNNL